MSDFRKIARLGSPYWGLVVFAIFASALVGLATAANAVVLNMLVDDVLVVPQGMNPTDFHAEQMQNLRLVIILAITVTFAKGLGSFLQTYSMSYVAQKIILQIKLQFFDHLQRLPLSFYARFRTGDLISRLNGDMLVIEQMLQTLIRIMVDPLVIITLVAYMLYLDWKLALFIFVFIPILGLLVRWLSKRLRRAGQMLQAKVGDISALIQESVVGIKIVKAFRMEEQRHQFFEREAQDNFRFSMKSVKYSALNSPVVELADAVGVALMIYFGSMGVIEGRLSAGELIGFLTSLGLLFHPIKKLTNGNAMIQQSVGAIQRVFEIFDEPAEQIGYLRKIPEEVKAALKFENLSFQFDESAWVLKDVNLEVSAGQTIALVGPSGGGKTSLVNLIPRFYPWQQGAIYLDGLKVDEFDLFEYRKLFGVVPQETVLFKGSILDNIRFAKPEATEKEVELACIAANAHEFISKLEGQYSHEIAEMGVGLSGGQRQRIAIARAILKDPKILILDEATSALDNESEKVVQAALDNLMKGRTTFVIAHRISTIVNADKIVVLEKGQIVAEGTHHELLKKSPMYKTLCTSGIMNGDQAA